MNYSKGEFISADKLENIYGKHPMVSQLMVYGDSGRDFLIAIVVPLKTEVLKWAKEKEIEATFDSLCENYAFKLHFLSEFTKMGKEAKV